ncbi:MAG: glycosyltransferase family 4 protein [Sphingomonadaceae bacterium]
MPLTDAFGGHGGIALYNRDTIRAFSNCEAADSTLALPRIVGKSDVALPSRLEWRSKAAGSLPRYATEALSAALSFKPDLIWCAHTNLLGLSRFLKHATGARLALATYGFEAWDPFPRRFDRWGLGGVDAVMAISRYTAARFAEWAPFDAGEVALLPNAIDLDAYAEGPKDAALEARYGLEGRKVVMLFGRMHPTERRKGFDQLIEALPAIRAKRPEVSLLLAGDGGDRRRLEAKVRELGLADHVVFPGRIEETEKAAHYRLADAYVMPSTQEGFGFVHLEAMACGIPAVASRCDGAYDAVRGGELGLLVDPTDMNDIVAQTLGALDRTRGRPEGLEYFSVPAFERRVCDFVQRVLR